jgi:hypothetical protein
VDYIPSLNAPSADDQTAGIEALEMDLRAESAQYELSFLIMESDKRDRISVRTIFNSRLFDAGSIAMLQPRFIAVLNWLTAGSTTSISEIDLAGINAAPPSRRVRVQLNIG